MLTLPFWWRGAGQGVASVGAGRYRHHLRLDPAVAELASWLPVRWLPQFLIQHIEINWHGGRRCISCTSAAKLWMALVYGDYRAPALLLNMLLPAGGALIRRKKLPQPEAIISCWRRSAPIHAIGVRALRPVCNLSQQMVPCFSPICFWHFR